MAVFSALHLLETVPADAGLGCSQKPGSFAFYYASRLTEEEISWLKRFDIVVTGDVLPPSQVQEIKRAKAKLFLYEWLTGFYLDKNAEKSPRQSWESFVRQSRPHWLLNPGKPHAGPDGKGRAYYYDPYGSELRFAWAKRLYEATKRASYDGVFFDLTGFRSVPEDLRPVYRERHSDQPYDQKLNGFLRSLKRFGPEILIFTNQGYRVPEDYLPAADYDLSESLMTSHAWGETVKIYLEGEGFVEKQETFYRPWEELKRVVDSITADIGRYNPKLKIYHLNYVNPLLVPTGRTEIIEGKDYPVFREEIDRPAIYYGYAAAKLWGHESYSSSPEALRFGQDEIYFADLGQPLGESYEERDGVVRRYYEKGVVALNPSGQTKVAGLDSSLIPPQVKKIFDCYERKTVDGFAVSIEPARSLASGRSYPAGRVYLYVGN